jgi:hypothetical protein
MRERAVGDRCVIAHTFLPLLIVQGYGGYPVVTRTATEYVNPSGSVEAAHDIPVRVLSEELADTHVCLNKVLVCPDTSMRKSACDPPEGLVDDWMGTVTPG